MSEFPFWDEVCLRNAIDRPLLPAPPRSLFDNDLFCTEGDLESLSQIMPPLPTFPLIPNPSKTFETSIVADESHSSAIPSTQVFGSPSVHYTSFPTELEALAHTSSPVPSLFAPDDEITDKNLDCLSPSTKPWGSFLDENCPLRRRVKVTIVPSFRKRDLQRTENIPHALSSPPLKKPRHSQSRVTAPRRLQTTFRVPRPGDPCTRLTLQIPTNSNKSQTNSLPASPTSAFGDVSPNHLDQQYTPIRSRFNLVPLNLESKLTLDATTECWMESPTIITRASEQESSVVSAELATRLSKVMCDNVDNAPSPSSELSELPLVSAAVEAVTLAAQAYNDTLALAAVPNVAVISEQQSRPQGPRTVKRRKGARRKRTLLSFDDYDVDPLVDEDYLSSRECALTQYLNSSAVV